MLLLAGCILPISPQFEDSPADPNFAPELVTARPAQGSIVTILPSSPQTFEITVKDPNPGDTLFVRWISDYPPYSVSSGIYGADVMLAPPTNGQPRTASVDVACLSSLSRDRLHPLTVLVADRKFPNDSSATREAQLTAIPDDARKIEVNWVVNLTSCPQ
jgi:hypothetical protein